MPHLRGELRRSVPAQAGVELRARDAFIDLIAQVQELAGDTITDPKDVWKPYHQHVEFRNLIAHGSTRGDEPVNGQVGGRAARSVAAARGFIDRIDATLRRLGLA